MENRKTVLEVYQEIMARASVLRRQTPPTEEVRTAIWQELYWVASLLEQTKEVNP